MADFPPHRNKDLAEYKHYVDRERAAGRDAPTLFLDNDAITVYAHDGEGRTIYPAVFESEPYTLLRQALDLLGIPHEEV